MQTFSSFNNLIIESLKSPQEFYITDDSKLPAELYGTFLVDENPYFMALVQSKTEGIYILEVGKAVNKNTMWWKFHSSKDIPYVLSTVISFIESSIPFLQSKLKGIVIKFRASASIKMDIAEKMIERIVKRSYIKTLRFYPTEKLEGTGERFLFIGRKTLSPQSIFNSKTFKEYTFSPSSEIPSDILSDVKHKKKLKKVLSKGVSIQYASQNLDVDVVAPEDVLQLALSVEKVSLKKKEIIEKPSVHTFGSAAEVSSMIMGIPGFSSMVQKLKKHGFDEKKVNWGDFQYVINELDEYSKQLLKSVKLTIDHIDSNEQAKQDYMEYMQFIANHHTILDDSKKWKKIQDQTNKWIKAKLSGETTYDDNWGDGEDYTPFETFKSNISPNSLPVTIPGYDIAEQYTPEKVHYGDWNLPSKHDNTNIKSFLKFDMGYDKIIGDLPTLSAIKAYTGSSYSEINKNLRDNFSNLSDNLSISSYNDILNKNSNTGKIYTSFNLVKPLQESFWVFRGATYNNYKENDILEKFGVGSNYIDPGFLSTTTRPDMGFGDNIRFMIYLPKGSKVLPVLDQSSCMGEDEIILPPAAVLKIIEVTVGQTYNKATRLFIKCIFIGSAHESILQLMKEKIEKNEAFNIKGLLMTKLDEVSKKGKYNPEEKFGGKIDPNLSKKLEQLIKSGKLKIDIVKSK